MTHSATHDAPENDPGWRVESPPTSFLAKRDKRPVLTGHDRNTAGCCRTCGTTYPCAVPVNGPTPTPSAERSPR